jgi:hypothetical protein
VQVLRVEWWPTDLAGHYFLIMMALYMFVLKITQAVAQKSIANLDGANWRYIWSRRLSQTGAVVVYSEDLTIEKRPKIMSTLPI